MQDLLPEDKNISPIYREKEEKQFYIGWSLLNEVLLVYKCYIRFTRIMKYKGMKYKGQYSKMENN